MKPSTKKELYNYYKSIIPRIKKIAKEKGYAVAIHGSMKKDLDVMAMPWTNDAKAPESLAIALMKEFLGHSYMRTYLKENRHGKPHGRLTYTLPVKGRGYIDLSVMPRHL